MTKLIQNHEEKKKVLDAFRRYREHPTRDKRVVKTKLGETILGTRYAISFVGDAPVRYYDFNGVLCHEEYGALDGNLLRA